MAEIFRAKTPKEAIELAIRFKESGRYDLFRGQNEDWPLVASINRLSNEKREAAHLRCLCMLEHR